MTVLVHCTNIFVSASFLDSCEGEKEREPGTHCLHMCQVPLVTCILLSYTKIMANFCLSAERPHCRVILPVRHIRAILTSGDNTKTEDEQTVFTKLCVFFAHLWEPGNEANFVSISCRNGDTVVSTCLRAGLPDDVTVGFINGNPPQQLILSLVCRPVCVQQWILKITISKVATITTPLLLVDCRLK